MTTPLRILHLRNSDLLGGPERLLLDQAALASPDVSHEFASFVERDLPHAFLDAAQAAGRRTHRIPQRSSYDPRLVRSIKRLVEQRAPDVLVSHDYKANVLALAAGRGLPRVAVVHGYTGEGAKIRFFEFVDRRLLRKLDAVVVVSAPLRDAVVARGVAQERVHEIPNGIRPDVVRAAARAGRAELRREWNLGAGDVALLTLGRLSPEKGQDVLMEALARMQAQRAPKVFLVGDGPDRAALTERASAPDLAGRVRFVGWRDDPWRCLGAADLFVLPSRSEGLPLALLEAMACGLPVVATRVGAVPDVLSDGAHGSLVAPDDPEALQVALDSLLSDPATRTRAGELARTRVESAFHAATQAQRLETLYRSLARVPRRAV